MHKQPEPKSHTLQLTILRTSVRESLQPHFKNMMLLIKAVVSFTDVQWLLTACMLFDTSRCDTYTDVQWLPELQDQGCCCMHAL